MTLRLASLLLLLCGSLHAQTLPAVPDQPVKPESTTIPDMQFATHWYCKEQNQCATVGLGVGTIRQDTPDKLKQFMVKHPGVKTLYLHGPGGELVGGLQLGVVVRQMGLDTALTGRMRCFSACVYAFLGGVEREVEEGGLLGVHQFSSQGAKEVSEDDIQQAQALLETYMRGMAVPRGLLDLAARTSNDKIFLINAGQAREMQIDNHGMQPADWTIGFPKGGGMAMAAKGRGYGSDRDVVFTIGTQNGRVGVAAIFAEPPINSSVRRDRETTLSQTALVICRHDGKTDVQFNNCVVAKPSTQWRNPKDRLYGIMFELEQAQVAALLQGASSDEVALGVWGGETGDDKVILLNTHANGFAQGVRTLLSQ